MDRLFSFLLRNKSVFSFKNRSRTGKTDDFSSPGLFTQVSGSGPLGPLVVFCRIISWKKKSQNIATIVDKDKAAVNRSRNM